MRPSIMSEGATMSVPASASMRRVVGEDVHRLVVGDIARFRIEHAVVAVVGVGIERDVGDDRASPGFPP